MLKKSAYGVNTVIVIFLVLGILLGSCKSEIEMIPRPRMYPRIVFPERNYVNFDKFYCPFSFKYPDYAEIVQDTVFFDEKPAHPCWFDLRFAPLNSSLHCSYYPIRNRADFDKFVNDAFNMAGKHNIKADAREEYLIQDKGISGIIFEIKGPVASPYQFFITDSLNHFMRGSLYINDAVNPDSTRIIVDFLKKDIEIMIEHFNWKG